MKKIINKFTFSSTNKLFFVILILGLGLRINGNNWDQDYHLHPDERFLTMVGTALKIPSSLSEYLNQDVSSLNPANIGNKFFVYGILPLTINKIPAVIFGNDNYGMYTLQGRLLSALIDFAVIYFVYKTVEIFEKKYKLHSSIKLWASFLYAISVLPIQLSHYFATDSFLNSFMFISTFFTIKFFYDRKIINLTGGAVFFGFAIASKLSALSILPVLMFLILFSNNSNKRSLAIKLFQLVLFILLSYFTVRLANPYMFKASNIFDPSINASFIQSLHDLKNMVNKDAWFPPAVQWVHKPAILFSLANLAILGVGLPYFFLILFGMYVIFTGRWFIKKGKRGDNMGAGGMKSLKILMFNYTKNILCTPLFVMAFWIIAFFLYQSTQFVKIMRYFIFIYPFMAIIASFGVAELLNVINKVQKRWRYGIQTVLIIMLLIWPLSFSAIYSHKHSRVVASEWIYANIPNHSTILTEHWDDGLPLPMVNNYGKTYLFKELPVFGIDDNNKWNIMNDLLNKGDYYILSSNRGWGSITTVPERYPKMTKYYEDLFANRTQFKKIKEFTSYPRICLFGEDHCLEMNDDWSDESFTVYDHPKVIIFQKERASE